MPDRPATEGIVIFSGLTLVRCIAGAALFLSSLASEATAESSIQRFSCVFNQRVSPSTNGISRTETLRYKFVVDGTGRAFAVGKNVYPVRVVVGDQGVTFLEELKTGAVQSTTIHTNGKAVHSRHTMLSTVGEIVPSQYYGTCRYSN